MELRVLNYFLAIAREENFTRAAEQLHVTQPTLSRQIADLETELGVKLFVRSNHNIILTEDGMLLKRRAQEILSLAERTKRDFLYKAEKLEGTVTIGSGEFLSTDILVDCINAFRQRYPMVRYELFSGNAENIKDGIERGFLDMGLMTEPIDIHKYEFISMPLSEQWGVWVQKNNPLSTKDFVTAEELVEQPLISPVGDIAESSLGRWFGTHLSDITVIAKGNLLYNEAILAQRNIGVILGIRLNCHYDNLQFIPLSPMLKTTTAIAWKKDHFSSNFFINYVWRIYNEINYNKLLVYV